MPLLLLPEYYAYPRKPNKSRLACPKPASSEASSYVFVLRYLSHGLYWPPPLSNPPPEQKPSSFEYISPTGCYSGEYMLLCLLIVSLRRSKPPQLSLHAVTYADVGVAGNVYLNIALRLPHLFESSAYQVQTKNPSHAYMTRCSSGGGASGSTGAWGFDVGLTQRGELLRKI